MINSHKVFGSLYEASRLPSVLLHFRGDKVIQSQVVSQLRCVELCTEPLGGQEETGDSEINLLSFGEFY